MSKPAKSVSIDKQIIADYVSNLIKNSHSINNIKQSVISILTFIDANPKYKRPMCKALAKEIMRFTAPLFIPPIFSNKNVSIIVTVHTPVFMLTYYLSSMDNADMIVNGLSRFVSRCDEFVEPIQEAITDEEIELVLDMAHRKYAILDIIAKREPLKILKFANSHTEFNCECGVTEENNGISKALIFVYHPISISPYNRVFIFAHELGHALHLTLTKDITVIPEGFDKFNENLGIKDLTLKERQETFADAAAIAILNCEELKEYLPEQLMKELPPYFDRYIKQLTSRYLETQ